MPTKTQDTQLNPKQNPMPKKTQDTHDKQGSTPMVGGFVHQC